mmetsp:Transcript_54759/g.108660  ORF Transcript_54759/g.108660 Transcript_54759/m.108660 type:complete len:431 (-) Transcript_54759:125-1417(-)
MTIGHRQLLFPAAVCLFKGLLAKAMTSSFTATKNKWSFASLQIQSRQILLESESSLALKDLEPILPGHCVVVPKRQVARLCELNDDEVRDLFEMVSQACQRCNALEAYGEDADLTRGGREGAQYSGPPEAEETGLSFNLSVKDGASAGQCVPHLHVHVVPRRPGDLPSSDRVYALLETWTPDRATVPASPSPLLADLMPPDDWQRHARSKKDMAAEADIYAAAFQQVAGGLGRKATLGLAQGSAVLAAAATPVSPSLPVPMRPGPDEEICFSQWLKLNPDQVFYQSPSGLTLAIVNLKPLVPGHVLVIPKRIAGRYADLTAAEREDLWRSVRIVQAVVCAHWCGGGSGVLGVGSKERAGRGEGNAATKIAIEDEEEPAGAHLGLQDGPYSGQSVAHVHVHILPAHTTKPPPPPLLSSAAAAAAAELNSRL